MFDHVQIKVRNLTRSRSFYAPVLSVLGYGVILEIEDEVVGFGRDPHNMFEIRQSGRGARLSRAIHIAFVARSEQAVRAFHSAALAQGATDNGQPGFRPDYEPGYYAAFVIDPDGHNLEAVFQAA